MTGIRVLSILPTVLDKDVTGNAARSASPTALGGARLSVRARDTAIESPCASIASTITKSSTQLGTAFCWSW